MSLMRQSHAHHKIRLASSAQLVHLALLAQKDHQDRLAPTDNLVHKATQDNRVHQAHQAHLETQDHQVHPASQVNLVQPDKMVNADTATQAHQVNQELQERQANPVQTVNLDKPEDKAHLVQSVHQAKTVNLEAKGIQDLPEAPARQAQTQPTVPAHHVQPSSSTELPKGKRSSNKIDRLNKQRNEPKDLCSSTSFAIVLLLLNFSLFKNVKK